MRIILALLCLAVINPAIAFDFKGIAVGKTASTSDVTSKLGVECGTGSVGRQICNGEVTIARESASMNLVIGPNGIVDRINLELSPESFDAVAPELIRKFGKPTSTSKSTVQNRMGARYPQVVYLWSARDGTQVIYSKYTISLDKSSLNFSTKSERDFIRSFLGKQNRSGDL
jgi:hypothetical protein